jgi:glutathione S-transferase
MVRLYAESFAPWCEKARWALDHHHVAYRSIEHVPMLGEAALRFAARRPLGRVTVPLLVDGDRAIMGSFEIARYAEGRGARRHAPLFPPGREGEVAAWNDRSEIVMTSGRAMLLPRMSRSPEALREQVPAFVPGSMRRLMTPVASMGVGYLLRKYEIRAGEDARHESAIREALDTLRAALAGGREYALGDGFSYADVTMAASLQFIAPVDGRYISLGPATRRAWTHEGLAPEYADLLAWRDRLYAAHR